MNVDNKHPFLRNALSDKTTVASPEQKLLDFALRNRNEKSSTKKEEQKEKSVKSDQKNNQQDQVLVEEVKIERDPMKLLKVF